MKKLNSLWSNMRDILDEVNDDATYQKKVSFFKNALIYSALIGVVVIIALNIHSSRQSKNKKLNQETSDMILETMSDQDDKESIAKLSHQIQDQDNHITNFAKLHLANLNLKNKNFDTAAKILHQIAKSSNASILVKAYAKLGLISISLDNPDLVKTEDIKKYIQEIDTTDFPLPHNSKIIKSLYLIQQKQQEEAKKLLKSLLEDDTTPEAIQTQAEAILANTQY